MREARALISKRHLLVGSAALIAHRGWAQDRSGGPATPFDVALRPELGLVLRPGDPPVPALRFHGAAPGGIIRLRRGEPARLRVRNDMTGEGSVAIVGVRGWGALDSPETRALLRIMPGKDGVAAFTPSDSGTALIRAAPSAGNEAQRGAVAALVVDDPAPSPVDHDVVVLVQDWLLGTDGHPRFGSTPPADATARVFTVNGRVAPDRMTVAPRSRVRLRLINASTQRAMLVAGEGANFAVVAIDGQPCELFAPVRDTIPVAPSARFDLMADLPGGAGRELRLVLRGTERLAGAMEPDQALLVLSTEGRALDARQPIAALPSNPALPREIALEAARRFDLTFDTKGDGTAVRWVINGREAGSVPLLTVPTGRPVTLGLVNATARLLPIRVSGHTMRVLHARDDGWDPYWRDTVLVPPKGRTHVAFVAEDPGLWVVESGFDDCALAGARCLFAVTAR